MLIKVYLKVNTVKIQAIKLSAYKIKSSHNFVLICEKVAYFSNKDRNNINYNQSHLTYNGFISNGVEQKPFIL